MDVRPGYKLTEVGVIPEEWDALRVCDCGSVITGGTPSTEIQGYWNGSYPWVTPTDIADQRDMWVSERMISESGLRSIRQLPPDSVLVTCIASIGKNAILRSVGGCNQQINAVVPLHGHSPEFLYYLFENSKQYLLANAGMTATRILSKAAFEQLKFPIPPKPEQRSIATALSDVDALLGGLDRLIAKKRDLKQAAMQQLLTGQIRLPGFSGEWEVRRLREIGSTYGGLTGKAKADFGIGSGRYVTFMNVMTNVVIDCWSFEPVRVLPHESQNQVHAGDLLFNGSSETPQELAMCAVMASDVANLYLNSFCFGFRLRDKQQSDGLFLAYYLRSNPGRELMKSLAQGSTRYNLSKAALLEASIRLPVKVEQAAIAAVLADIDAELAALESRRDKTQALKQGMMQELLSGRTRFL